MCTFPCCRSGAAWPPGPLLSCLRDGLCIDLEGRVLKKTREVLPVWSFWTELLHLAPVSACVEGGETKIP